MIVKISQKLSIGMSEIHNVLFTKMKLKWNLIADLLNCNVSPDTSADFFTLFVCPEKEINKI